MGIAPARGRGRRCRRFRRRFLKQAFTLSGSALHLAEFATNASVGTLGAFTVTGSDFVLNNSGPLTIAGPLSAQYIAITALGQVTLAGTIATMGVPVAQQSGVQPAAAGSFIDVLPGASVSASNPGGVPFPILGVYQNSSITNNGTLSLGGPGGSLASPGAAMLASSRGEVSC